MWWNSNTRRRTGFQEVSGLIFPKNPTVLRIAGYVDGPVPGSLPPSGLIGLEEPELAIHPGAMAVLADTMKEASLRGQVLVATHSPDLINLLPYR